MADAFFMLRVLADANIELIFPDSGGGQEVAARAGAAELIDRLARIAKELPNNFARLRLQTVQVTVAAGKDHLRLAGGVRVHGVRPLAVHDLLAGIILLPSQLARLLVERDKTWGIRRRNVDVAFVDTVARDDVEKIADDQRRTGRQVVREDIELTNHVIVPKNLSFEIGADHLAAVADVIQAAAFDDGGGAN